MTKKILAIIPARGGSKGIPKKNIVDLGGKPLIAWTIEASLKSKYITDTYVSSDDDEILNISKKYGANTIKRPAELATDTATSESVVEHIIYELKKQHKLYDCIVLLQPTSPFRDEKIISGAIESFFSKNATSLISVNEIDNKVLKAFVENKNGFIEGIKNNIYPFLRRQDLPKVYMSNGAIYIIKTDEFLRDKSFWTPKTIEFIIGEKESLDIDSINDLDKVKKCLKR